MEDFIQHEGRKGGTPVHSGAEHAYADDAHDGGDEGGIWHPRHAFVVAASYRMYVEICNLSIQS